MVQIFNFCWMMLGWFVAGLIFLFCTALLVATIVVTIAITIDLYDYYIKKGIRR